jgi:invasion protein IalB
MTMKSKFVVAAVLALSTGCATAGGSPQAARAPVARSAPLTSQGAPAEGGARAQGGEGAAVASAEGQGEKGEVQNPNELVCTSQQVTGQRYPKRVCRTRQQIEAERGAALNEMNTILRNNNNQRPIN